MINKIQTVINYNSQVTDEACEEELKLKHAVKHMLLVKREQSVQLNNQNNKEDDDRDVNGVEITVRVLPDKASTELGTLTNRNTSGHNGHEDDEEGNEKKTFS